MVTTFRHANDENMMQIVFFKDKLKIPKETYILRGSTFCDFWFRRVGDENW
jgi:hypothetical protein